VRVLGREQGQIKELGDLGIWPFLKLWGHNENCASFPDVAKLET
jgi:hypothetical protein